MGGECGPLMTLVVSNEEPHGCMHTLAQGYGGERTKQTSNKSKLN